MSALHQKCCCCRSLGQKVFSRPGTAAVKEEEAGWKDSLYKFYKSGQQSMRVAVYGCKHDAGMFEELLKEYCLLDPAVSLGNTMIDTACLNAPKVNSSSGATLVAYDICPSARARATSSLTRHA